MRYIFLRGLLIFMLVMPLTFKCALQQKNYDVVFCDVLNFWRAVDSLKNAKDSAAVFQSLVIEKASSQFCVFIKKWNIKAEQYVKQIRKFQRFYSSLRWNSLRLIMLEDSIRKTVERFKKLYDGFVTADICVGFGNFSTGGNVELTREKNYVYIGLEFHGLNPEADIRELPASLIDYVSRSNFMGTIIHELVHIQQETHGKKVYESYYGNKLMHHVLREGIPDCIAQLLLGQEGRGNFVVYGLKNEQALKQKLKQELMMEGIADWFGGADSLFVFKPHDLGYFMGCRIAQAYLKNKLKNKVKLKALIEIKEPEVFVLQSGYFLN